ncbi:MAG TPA: type II toxin-antitoxin system mRNA interferase toxin, RelE/StbE family [Anaerolineae bacterium]|nr:type II toxin-antitoxin system mRNA interferase toxin, RelE/StbE family [Anaerolineae bacterium]
MKIAFEASFARDLKHIRNKQLLQQVQQVIENVKEAATIDTVRGLKKMQGYDTFYRLRLGDYRIGIEVVDDQVIFVRFLHRKDVYRYFP